MHVCVCACVCVWVCVGVCVCVRMYMRMRMCFECACVCICAYAYTYVRALVSVRSIVQFFCRERLLVEQAPCQDIGDAHFSPSTKVMTCTVVARECLGRPCMARVKSSSFVNPFLALKKLETLQLNQIRNWDHKRTSVLSPSLQGPYNWSQNHGKWH